MKTEDRKTKRYTIAAQAGVLSALALGMILVGSEPTRAFVRSACEASFEPTAVPAGSEAATVFYQLSEGIGDLEGASAESGSGLTVTGHDSEMSTLTFNTADAKPGSWSVTFHGQDDQICAGSLEVSQPEDTRA